MSGRINIMEPGGTPLFLQENVKIDDKTSYYNSTKYMLQPNELTNSFFNYENINLIHQTIKKKVYENTNRKYVIDNQDIPTLKTIMRSIFLQYSKLNHNKVQEDINELNRLVINYCTKNIIGEIESYLKYKRDVSTIAMPIEHPVYLHNDNTLEFKRFI
jgi:hypothetical protein